jgi:tRNA threonylcarbamoyladenosine biosynthesis protein TsaE
MHPEVKRQVFENITLTELDQVASKVVQGLKGLCVVVFHGEMGSGKTTFVKAMGKVLGVKDAMSSPTFSIVNEYRMPTARIFHFDFYRLKNETEAYDIGIEEYFDSGDLCLVEWPEKIPSLLPETYAEVHIAVDDDTHRTIAFSIHDGKEEKRI